MPDELESQIDENAKAPRTVQADGVSTTEHPLPDQVEADRFLASKDAVKTPWRGLRVNKISPPGA